MYVKNLIARGGEDTIMESLDNFVERLDKQQMGFEQGNFPKDLVSALDNILHLVASIRTRLNALEDYYQIQEQKKT